jgi:hypothetical protein
MTSFIEGKPGAFASLPLVICFHGVQHCEVGTLTNRDILPYVCKILTNFANYLAYAKKGMHGSG